MFFNLFKRKKKNEEEIKFDGVRIWLDESTGIKSILDKFQLETETYFSQIRKSIQKTEADIETLKAVTLENKKVNKRIIGMVLQNRDAYVEHVQHLADKLKKDVELTKPNNLEDVEKFVLIASGYLNSFSKQTFKAFHMTSELIGKELESVVSCIAAISSNIERIKAVDKKKIKTIESVKNSLEDITEKEKITDNLKTDIADKQMQKAQVSKAFLDAEKKNEEIKASPEWKRKQALIFRISLLNKELQSNSTSALALFLSIEKALKKWAWKEKNNKIFIYLEKPLTALKQDKDKNGNGFEILNILEIIKEELIQDKLNLDEKRKNQLLKSISVITKEKLISLLSEEARLKKQIEQHEQKLSNWKIKPIDTATLAAQKNDIAAEIAKLEKKQDNLKHIILDNKNKIENLIKNISDIKLIR